ncbi:MAG: glycosyl hydrolase 53 family protein [Gemmatimonadales bacterium]|nr:glycosyl hydrolase 53 family protein [Gemmatimonadales bacterium]
MTRAHRAAIAAFILATGSAAHAAAQATPFVFGADLSYANQMDDCGAVFRDGGAPKDVFRIFADHGHTLVRVRLWVDPAWQRTLVQPPGVPLVYGDLDDVRRTIRRAKGAGMQVLLDMHYSDIWADPQRQAVPARWRAVARDTPALADSVHAYTAAVLRALAADGLLPDMVQVGNEINPGILVHGRLDPRFEGRDTIPGGWARQAALLNAGIRAVREAGRGAARPPKVMLHFAAIDTLVTDFRHAIEAGVTDFDVMGFSYYYAWHGGSLAKMAGVVRALRARWPRYEVMAVEAGYAWTTANHDAMPNIIGIADPQYTPLSPAMQLRYLVDYAVAVHDAGGIGVVLWEPAWVSTPCRTPWGRGSAHDHVAFFTPDGLDYMADGGGAWAERARGWVGGGR